MKVCLSLRLAVAVIAAASLVLSTGCRKKKYENPITKDTLQPDKVLFDKAINDIERGRYEVARITLNTLMNTYDTSEYLAKAKLAIADSWFREGGGHGLGQAEAEYKDFILFYPTMEESAEAQEKVCMIHYNQMEKADRDPKHSLRAEDECKLVLNQFPNSKFAPEAQQKLRDIQEVIADGEYRVGSFYYKKGSNPAAANRFEGIVSQYPIFSQTDEALFMLGDAYSKMGPRFRDRAGDAYTKLVRDYPLSARVDESKELLTKMELPVPEANPTAYARMKYELENQRKVGMMFHTLGIFRKSPDMHLAAKSGAPQMETLKPSIPVSVPVAAAEGEGGTGTGAVAGGGTGDVAGQVVQDPTQLDQGADARSKASQDAAKKDAEPAKAEAAKPNEPLPGNHTGKPVKAKKDDKKKKK